MTSAAKGLAAALVAAQADMPAVEPDAENPHFKTRFVSLDHLIAKTRSVLNRHGLAISQLPATNEHGLPVLQTILLHGPTGEQLVTESPLILAKNDMQGLGAAITYARRYAWAAMLGIASDEDDDGNTAAQHTPAEKPKVDMSDPDIPFGDAPVEGVNQPPARKVTEAQKKKLNVLVADLRDQGNHVSTEQLYGAIATLRGVERDELVLQIGGLDDQGVLRWRRLRDALKRDEARQLIDWLELKQQRVQKEEPAGSPFQVPAGVPVPYDTFPEGY